MKKREIVSYILWFLCITLVVSKDWLIYKFGNVEFSQYLFHLLGPKDGTNTDIFVQYFLDCGIKIVIILILFIFLYHILVNGFSHVQSILNIKIRKHKIKIHILDWKWLRNVILPISLLLFAFQGYVFIQDLGIMDYYELQKTSGKIYESFYVDPKEKVTFEENKRNLILIYLESMENTYSSVSNNGAGEEDYIQELTSLAQNNINFSNRVTSLGGAVPISGTGWTSAALLATTSGVNLKLPVDYNYVTTDTYLGGIYTLGDLLQDNGYNQTYMIGSDADFGNRSAYYKTHGNYNIVDYKKAIENKWIEEDYYVWWGYEDGKLFDYAKDELIRLAKEEAPFNLTLLTVDTHFVDGYLEEDCEKKYDNQFKNVLSCSSKMVNNFITWIKEQDFYQDTTIVITGDHLTMDQVWISENVDPTYERTIYNAFINSKVKPINQYNRTFTSLDLYPTIVASMGGKIEGDRLGLGVNLFSDKKTLAEELGIDVLNQELAKNSKFYNNHFIYGK